MSCLALWHLFDPETIGGQVIGAAADRNQASIIFKSAVKPSLFPKIKSGKSDF